MLVELTAFTLDALEILEVSVLPSQENSAAATEAGELRVSI